MYMIAGSYSLDNRVCELANERLPASPRQLKYAHGAACFPARRWEGTSGCSRLPGLMMSNCFGRLCWPSSISAYRNQTECAAVP